MRLLVFAQNRLVGLGVASLAERYGFEMNVSSVEQALATSRCPADLVLCACNAWDDDCRRVVERLRALRIAVWVVVRGMDAITRRTALLAGALQAFSQDETDELAAVLANHSWNMAGPPEEFTLANGLTVSLTNRALRCAGRDIPISLTECRICSVLRTEALTRGTEPVPMPVLKHAIWGDISERATSTLRGCISRLRNKIETDPEQPTVLCGRRKEGYWLVLADQPDRTEASPADPSWGLLACRPGGFGV